MAGKVELGFTISKNAAKLIKKGAAQLSSGGVRGCDGKLIELAKPAVSSAAGKLTSPVTMVSSLANNVQSGFIQHGVNKANRKLDVTLDKLDALQRAVGKLGSSAALGWVNCAVGIANCGISIAGFYMTLSKLDEISEQIKNLSDKWETDRRSDDIERFDKYSNFIWSDIGKLERLLKSGDDSNALKEKFYNITAGGGISDHIDEISAYLKRIIEAFQKKTIDGEFGCNIIFNLSIALAKEIKEYSAVCFYLEGEFPENMDRWLQVFNSIDSDIFKDVLKEYLTFECSGVSRNNQIVAYAAAVGGIEQMMGEIAFTKNLVKSLPLNRYVDIDGFISGKLQDNEYEEIGEMVWIPVSST